MPKERTVYSLFLLNSTALKDIESMHGQTIDSEKNSPTRIWMRRSKCSLLRFLQFLGIEVEDGAVGLAIDPCLTPVRPTRVKAVIKGDRGEDFGQTLVNVNGVLHRTATHGPCSFFRGVPCRISYENARTRVSQILGAYAGNFPFAQWTVTFGSERLTSALLDRRTHGVHLIEANGEGRRTLTTPPAAQLPCPLQTPT